MDWELQNCVNAVGGQGLAHDLFVRLGEGVHGYGCSFYLASIWSVVIVEIPNQSMAY